MADFVIGTARDTSLYIQIGNTRYPLHISTEAKNINGLSDTIIEVLRNDKQLLTEIVDYLLHNTNLLSDYAKKSDISTVYKYKGSVNTYSALPEARYNTLGDVYNIIQADEANKINAGDNVVWTGTTWDNLAGIVKIDLSPTVFNVTGKDDVLTVTKGDGSSYNIVVNKVGHASTADSATSASKFTNVETATFTINADRPVWMSDSEDSNKPVKGNLTYNTSTNTLTLGTTNNGQIIGNATSSNYLTLQIIPSNTDLNTITTPGEYGSNTDTVTGTLKNLPYAVKSDNTAESFHLSVFKDVNTNNSIKQILMTQTSGREWYRYINGTTITNWTKFNSGTADTLTTGRSIITNLASTKTATFDGSTNITPGVTGILPEANGGTGSSSLNSITVGNAKTADVLTTGRNITTNLASTQSATFNGSKDITPGVSGVLPVANGGTGNTDLAKVNVGSATKLQTARSVTTNLASTTAATFDGTANITPGVSGILPVANGGTGSSSLANINVGTATKLQTARTISLTGNATGSTSFDGSGNVSINTTVNESKHAVLADTLKSSSATETSTVARPVWLSWEGDNTKQTVTPNLTYTCSTKTLTATNFKGHLAGNADSATKLSTARTVQTNLASTSSASFDGSANITPGVSGILPVANGGTGASSLSSITVGKATTADSAANADKVDGYHESSFLRYRASASAAGEDTLWSQIGIKQYNEKLPKGISGTYNYGAVVSLPGDGPRLDIWYNHQCSANGDGLWYRSGWDADQKAWARLIDSNNYTIYTPTKTGTGASGTWDINISGTAAKATSDSSGNNINSTYVKSVTYSGHTVTVTKGNGTTSTFNTADTNTTYPVATTTANGLMASTDKTKLNGIATGAEVNQNAFSNVTVGSTTISADNKTDTLTLVAGSNITLTPDATNDKITISSTATVSDTDLNNKVAKAGDTMTGLLKFANVSTDATSSPENNITIGGLNGSLGIQALQGYKAGVSLMNYSTTWNSTVESGTIEYNNDTKSIDFVFNS